MVILSNCLTVGFASPRGESASLWVTRLEPGESIGRDRVRPSRSLHSEEKRRKSSRGETKSENVAGKGWNCLLMRELLFGNIFGPGKHIALSSSDLACARRKTHMKNRITASSREILKIYGEPMMEVVERENKAGNALVEGFYRRTAFPQRNMTARPKIARQSHAENQFSSLVPSLNSTI